ncbi:conserved hypothetical protein [Pediculus humanus corporis]|uniref:UBR-type domain-containing protein n=1 Tax=Pediculus humanus subsp. corporis TaxID=121224 RepID=E0VFB1_PEDHC|nr:uncharacterized protein Phum_PHUM153970 [Pediculus humanus corporis]EEB12067.1 conserved hypothetical protein [Pediculus humanus corporis]
MTDSSDLNNIEKEDESVVTMVDVLQEENELEEDANAVLGGADDKICTYSKGYIFRQPLYACATCNSSGNGKLGGICLACSYRCHEGHELIELYTKRNFRCDCGNSCFPNTKCNLEIGKDDFNVNNSYNQNFTGIYCNCKRPYPDPDDTIDDEMIQCVICEDWFHKRHLNNNSIPSDYGEMICYECMENHLFLWKYSDLHLKAKSSLDDSSNQKINNSSIKNNIDESQENKNEKESDVNSILNCKIKTVKTENGSGSTFWPDGWRKSLCKCDECLKMYDNEKISFLLSDTDTVQYYENRNKALAKESQYEKGLKALSSLDRVKQVEAIEGYNEMKSELMGYLQKFAESKKVVREEDIREFFSQMQARKKHKVEVPYYCH